MLFYIQKMIRDTLNQVNLMEYNEDKIDEMALALLFLTLHDYNRVWKSLDWDVMNRLYEKGFTHDPKNKNKSLVLTHEGLTKAKDLFEQHFSVRKGDGS
jgi:hypothetical protein